MAVIYVLGFLLWIGGLECVRRASQFQDRYPEKRAWWYSTGVTLIFLGGATLIFNTFWLAAQYA